MNRPIRIFWIILLLFSCNTRKSENSALKQKVLENDDLRYVKSKALEVVSTGFNAGDGYGEVWIRDYNTFIELSSEVFEADVIVENLLVFFRMQGPDGNIIDGFIPSSRAGSGYDYIYSDLEPRYAGHKNTVETDQESSLVQAVYKYIKVTGKRSFLDMAVGGKTVADRLEWAMEFLMDYRYHEEYGLLWGATTADWGDVQPEHEWGVYFTEDTHYAIDIYDNAMFLIALDNLVELLPDKAARWVKIRNDVADACRLHLWDEEKEKFLPHIYLNGSPFPDDFDEDQIFYHGGTAVAIEAGLLSAEEVGISLQKMRENVKASGAATIGLTLYPPYPEGFFKNPEMYPYGYQNGGDWTWFGGRMVQQLIRYGMLEEAYRELLPMLERVRENDGFYEWYTIKNEPKGSGTFRGSAGVLYKAIILLQEELDPSQR